MEPYLKIPLTFVKKGGHEVLARAGIEDAIKQFIDMLIETRQGECIFDQDFGYELWSTEFEPILNMQQWQPKFMEQIKYLLEKYEERVTDIQVGEPEIRALIKRHKTDKDYRITLIINYRIKSTGETQHDVKISFEY